MRLIRNIFGWIALLSCFVSCKKLVEIDPPQTSINSGNVYASDATAAAVLTGIYTILSQSSPATSGSIMGISLKAGLSADEFTLFGSDANLTRFYRNELTNSTNETIWENGYQLLYFLNLALERLNTSTGLTNSVKQQLMGEARFVRAYVLFYLVNFFGDIPLITTSDYRTNSKIARTAIGDIYAQIKEDLLISKDLLSETYLGADVKNITSDRVRPTKGAAIALLSRVYLYTGDWKNAESESTLIIGNTAKFDTVPLSKVFLKNSKEAIWQLQPVNSSWNTEDARLFILPDIGPNDNNPVYLSDDLYSAFQQGDKRPTEWIGNVQVGNISYNFPKKYKSANSGDPVTEYLMMLRVGEQFLIRAEARAQMNNIQGALGDLNIIRLRAGLTANNASDKNVILEDILLQRRLELFSEWGHRWLDLKRTAAINRVMADVAVQKGTTWSSTDQYYPIPLYDIQQNPLILQNSGY